MYMYGMQACPIIKGAMVQSNPVNPRVFSAIPNVNGRVAKRSKRVAKKRVKK